MTEYTLTVCRCGKMMLSIIGMRSRGYLWVIWLKKKRAKRNRCIKKQGGREEYWGLCYCWEPVNKATWSRATLQSHRQIHARSLSSCLGASFILSACWKELMKLIITVINRLQRTLHTLILSTLTHVHRWAATAGCRAGWKYSLCALGGENLDIGPKWSQVITFC